MRLLLGMTDVSTAAFTALGLLVIFVSKTLGIWAPFALRKGVNALGTQDPAGLAWIAAFAGLKASSQMLNNAKNIVLSLISRPLGRRLAEKLYGHLLGLELQFHALRRTGALLRRLERSSRAVDTLLRAVLFTLLPVCIELVVVSRILAGQGIGVVGAVLGAFATYWVFTGLISLGWVTRARRRMNTADDLQSSKATDALLNVEQVKLASAEPREEESFGSAQRRLQGASQSSDVAASVLSGGQQVITSTGLGVALWCVGRKVLAGTASVGDVFMVHNLIMQLWAPLQFLGFYVREARQAFVDLEDARRLLSRNSGIAEPLAPVLLPASKPSVPVVEFSGVSFSYAENEPLLQDVSFSLLPGAYTALVGPSGCGKSTLGRLVPRLLDVQAGAVRFNGVNVRSIPLAELRGRIAVVSQDVVVFNDSLRYNLLYAQPDATEAQLTAALEGSQLDRTVAAMPDGLETIVGERGLRLSGGERQRLALARALMRAEPELLILDEATSALDSEAERKAMQALCLQGRRWAVLAITHRLATARTADEILVLKGGRIVERGAHNALAAKGGDYASMLRASEQRSGPI